LLKAILRIPPAGDT